MSGRHSLVLFPVFGLPAPCDQKMRFRPLRVQNRIGVACGAGREFLKGVSPGPDHRTRTVHTGMAARWGAPVVHAHAARGAGEAQVWVRWPHHAAWGGLMGAPMSPDGRRVLPWPEIPARWCTRVHAPWRGGERRRGPMQPEPEYPLLDLSSPHTLTGPGENSEPQLVSIKI